MTRSPEPPRFDPALLRGLTSPRYGRRDAFRIAGLSAAGLMLAACGVEGKAKAPPKADEAAKFWQGKKATGRLVWANWPGYMEPKDKSYPLLDRFTEETGTEVTYKEVIQDNASFFGKIEKPLAAGQSIGYDLMVITNGVEMSKLKALGYLIPLDHSQLPNVKANAGASFMNQAYDPGNVHSVPYESGITGIAYNAKYVDWEITKISDLWDPRLKGKVGMFSDMQEIANFALMMIGVAPEKATPAQWRQAAAKLQEQRDKELVRKYYEQDYIEAISRGDVWACQAWSGDIFQTHLTGGADIKFIVPEEGGTIWTDNLMIPKGAENPVDALKLINWLYDPENNAELTEYINYIPPVPKTKEIIQRHAAEASGEDKEALEAVATSPLVFPSEQDKARLHPYQPLTTEMEQEMRGIFMPIVEG